MSFDPPASKALSKSDLYLLREYKYLYVFWIFSFSSLHYFDASIKKFKAVCWFLFLNLASPPCSSRSLISSSEIYMHELWYGVTPPLSLLFGSAPCFSSNSIASVYFQAVAHQRGPCLKVGLLFKFGSSLYFWSMSFKHFTAPVQAAICIAVISDSPLGFFRLSIKSCMYSSNSFTSSFSTIVSKALSPSLFHLLKSALKCLSTLSESVFKARTEAIAGVFFILFSGISIAFGYRLHKSSRILVLPFSADMKIGVFPSESWISPKAPFFTRNWAISKFPSSEAIWRGDFFQKLFYKFTILPKKGCLVSISIASIFLAKTAWWIKVNSF